MYIVYRVVESCTYSVYKCYLWVHEDCTCTCTMYVHTCVGDIMCIV